VLLLVRICHPRLYYNDCVRHTSNGRDDYLLYRSSERISGRHILCVCKPRLYLNHSHMLSPNWKHLYKCSFVNDTQQLASKWPAAWNIRKIQALLNRKVKLC